MTGSLAGSILDALDFLVTTCYNQMASAGCQSTPNRYFSVFFTNGVRSNHDRINSINA